MVEIINNINKALHPGATCWKFCRNTKGFLSGGISYATYATNESSKVLNLGTKVSKKEIRTL